MARNWSTKSDGRSFDDIIIEAVWQKGTPEQGYTSFRKDVCTGFKFRYLGAHVTDIPLKQRRKIMLDMIRDRESS